MLALPGPHEELVRRFRATRRLSFFLDDTSATRAFDFSPAWYDIRLLDLQVYLVGARNTHAAADPDTRRIDVTSTWDIIWAGRQ